MLVNDLNDDLREILRALEKKGYKKTDIGKLLLGGNGYAPLCRFIASGDKRINFGVKPLARIAEQAGYTLQLSIIKKSDIKIIETMNDKTHEFFVELPGMIETYLNNSYSSEMQKTRKSKASESIDDMMSELGL